MAYPKPVMLEDDYENYSPSNHAQKPITLNLLPTATDTINSVAKLSNVSTSPYLTMDPALSKASAGVYESQKEFYDLNNQMIKDRMGSTMYKMQPYIKGFGDIASGLGSLANIYAGFQQLGIAKDQLNMAKEQWATTKDEINRIRNVRNTLNTNYMA